MASDGSGGRALDRPRCPGCLIAATAGTMLVMGFAALGCVTFKSGRLQPGFVLPISEPARDPSPTRDPTEMYMPRQSYIDERGTQPAAELPPWLSPRVQELVAVLAVALTGALPLLNIVVIFDENALFDEPVAPSP